MKIHVGKEHTDCSYLCYLLFYISREPVEHPTCMGKIEDPGPMMSPNGYLPMHSMMPPHSAGIGQSPTSTTLDLSDHRDMYHPALMNPHLIASDGRRIKQEHNGGSF